MMKIFSSLSLPTLVIASLLVQACGDSGVAINEGGVSGGSSGSGGSGGSTGSGGSGGSTSSGGLGGGQLTESFNSDGFTGTVQPTSSVSNLNAEDVAASRFLAQATFGASSESIAQLRSAASFSEWIDEQMALPVSLTEPYTRIHSNGSMTDSRHEIWWNNALDEPDQLRQRVAFALSQLFVVSDQDFLLANNQYGVTNYYDTISLNAFSNYRELLEKVTLHPVMGVYLSMVRNEKADLANNIRPDENYAREVLQLFSIGLFQLNNRGEALPLNNPVPAYTQSQVEEFARVFTGWSYSTVSFEGNNLGFAGTFTNPMVPFEEFHDTGAKNLLNGAVAPAGLSTRDDLEFALDNIFQHANVGVLVSRHLIQQLVTSNPSGDYIERMTAVFNNNGGGVRGDLGALVKAILLDPEARNGHLSNPDFGKLREPVLRLAHVWRALDGTPGTEAEGVHNTSDFTLLRIDEMAGQAVMSSPSVFNFFKPDNTIITGGQTKAPVMEIMTESNLATTHNNYHDQIYRFNTRSDIAANNDNTRVTIVDLEPLIALAEDPDDLLDWYNLILFAGGMDDNMRQTLSDYMNSLPSDDAGRYAKVQDTLFMVLTAPQFHLQR